MRTFGEPRSCSLDLPHVATPIGWRCLWCEEEIQRDDQGFVMDLYGLGGTVREVALHAECQFRSILGSVGHLSKRCSCFGGTEEDPPHMTRREAARAAMALYGRLEKDIA